MKFEEIDILTPIKDFISKYPNMNMVGEIIAVPFSPNTVDGNGVQYSGQTKPSITTDVNGNKFVSLQANFILYIRRQLVDKSKNEEQANFIFNFERWVLLQYLQGKTPKFSNFDNQEEMFWADTGFLWEVEENADIPHATYQIQMHCQYNLRFNNKFEEESRLERLLNS